MSPQTSISATSTVPFARSRPRSNQVLQYELNVVASSAADVVREIGGWLFDRRMAGWHVSVALTDPADERALRILGLKAVELTGLWQSAGDPEYVAMTAIATDRFDSDNDVRLRGLSELRDGPGGLAFWGADCPEQLGGQVHRARYRLSAAARAFKAQALVASGETPARVGAVETMFRCGHGVLDAELAPY
ncbi:hypothetical protein [Mycolicibacterium sp. XJ870]